MNPATIQKRTARRLAQYRHAARSAHTEAAALRKARSHARAAHMALAFAQKVAAGVQAKVHQQLAGVVCSSLAAVFDTPYTFKINFHKKRGRTEAELVFLRGGITIDPVTAAGGGVVDVAAFALRVGALLLARPPLRRLLILDEPFKNLSAEHHERARELVERLARDLGVQIVMITHNPAYNTGRIVQL